MQALENQELLVRSVALLLLVVSGGLLLLALFPQPTWTGGISWWNRWYLPVLCLACVVISALFSVYGNKKRQLIIDARKTLAGQMGAKDLSLLDPLTGLLNRSYLDQNFSKEIGWAERIGISLTLLLIDLDAFKVLNSRHGRSTGNRVLTDFAELLKKNFRTTDTLIRYGGDEFVVMLPGFGQQKAQVAVERLQEMTNAWNRQHSIDDYALAFSWGAAAHAKGTTIADLLETAHRELDQHKTRRSATG
jgi:diguanylate cyclase (GGDEF)-like protein